MKRTINKPGVGKELRVLGKHGLTYGLATILSRVAGFLMIPLYTHYLGPSDYGVLQLVGITTEVIGIVLGLGIAGAIYRFYYDSDDPVRQRLVVSTACLGLPLLGALVIGLLATQADFMAGFVLEGPGQGIYILLALVTLWFNQLVDLTSTYLRVRERSMGYLWLSLSKLVLSLSLNIYFVAIAQIGVIGIFISNLIAAGVFTVATYPWLLKKVGFGFSWEIARNLLRFSLPIIPSNLASLVVNASDRYFIKAFISMGEAGIYSLGYRFGSIVFYFVRVPFMQIWEPRRYKLYQEGASPELFARIATYFIGLMCVVGLGIAVFIQDLIKVISPQEFWSAARYAPAVVLCYIVYAFDNHVAFGILVKKKTEYWTYVNFSVAGINLVLNFWWIAAFGAWGAIAATLVSVILKIVGLHLISRRLFYIPFEWGRMGGFLAVAGLAYGLGIAWHPQNLWLALVYDASCIMIYLSVLWVVGLIDLQEKQYLLEKCRKFLGFSGSKLSEPGI